MLLALQRRSVSIRREKLLLGYLSETHMHDFIQGKQSSTETSC